MSAQFSAAGRRLAAVTLVAGCILSVAAFLAARRWAQELESADFRSAAESRVYAFRRELRAEISKLSLLADVLGKTESRSRDGILEALASAAPVSSHYLWIGQSASAPVLPPGLKGLDPTISNLLNASRDSGALTATRHFRGGPLTAGRVAVLAIAPVYDGGETPASVEVRRTSLRGFVAAVLLPSEILDRALLNLRPHGIDLLISETDLAAGDPLLHYHHARGSRRGSPEPAGPPSLSGRTLYSVKIRLADRDWDFACAADPATVSGLSTWKPWTTLILGLVLTLSLTSFVQLLALRSSRVERVVEERTRELSESNQRLEVERERALEASRLKSQFLANMSHEIRTPMNGIIGFAQLALATELNEDQKDYIETVASSADLLMDIINDILDVSKIEAGRMELDQQPFSLRECLENCIDTLRASAQQKRLGLYLTVDPTTPDAVQGDALRLRQILLNLIGNSIKFTEKGLVSLEVTSETTADRGLVAHFRIRDTGIGIPEEKQRLIFEPFRQVDGSTTRKYGGTGLGLTICARLVEMMGGQIWVESSSGFGSIFHFTVRLELADIIDEPAVQSSSPAREGGRHSVLVAEDNLTSQRLIAALLQKHGYDVAVALDGREAVHLASRRAFDLILMDIQMPEMDGLEATAEIRRADQQTGNHTRIVALTAHAMKGDRERCLSAGMDGYVAKPIRTNELLTIVAEMVRNNVEVRQ
jgi:signal transduction histidine kinase/ActR/RegA family two-component response regulator